VSVLLWLQIRRFGVIVELGWIFIISNITLKMKTGYQIYCTALISFLSDICINKPVVQVY